MSETGVLICSLSFVRLAPGSLCALPIYLHEVIALRQNFMILEKDKISSVRSSLGQKHIRIVQFDIRPVSVTAT